MSFRYIGIQLKDLSIERLRNLGIEGILSKIIALYFYLVIPQFLNPLIVDLIPSPGVSNHIDDLIFNLRIRNQHFKNGRGNPEGTPASANFDGRHFHHNFRSQISPSFPRLGVSQHRVSNDVILFGQSQNDVHVGLLSGFFQVFTPGIERFIVRVACKLAVKCTFSNLFRTAK